MTLPSQRPDDVRSAAQSVALDWAALREHLAAQGLRLDSDPPPRQFAGGLANLNYLIHSTANPLCCVGHRSANCRRVPTTWRASSVS